MSGITLAAQLLGQKILQRGEFVIMDRWNDYGGVWEANKYPGAACDVPVTLTSCFSFDPVREFSRGMEPGTLTVDWSREYASQAEIQTILCISRSAL